MYDKNKIDELLNGYLDQELTARQQNEVNRLLNNDPDAARRFEQLRKMRMLLGSLAREQAPEGLCDQVTTEIERHTLFEDNSFEPAKRTGQASLMMRRVLSAAAMLALTATLSVVVYRIVATDSAGEVFSIGHWQQVDQPQSPQIMSPQVPGHSFAGTLELTAEDAFTVDAAFNRALARAELLGNVESDHQMDQKRYTVTCSRRNLTALLVDMQNVWGDLAQARLVLESDDGDLHVPNILPEQLARIIQQEDAETMTGVADSYARRNVADQTDQTDQIAPVEGLSAPKPVLTGGRDRQPSQATLTIIISPTH